MQKINKRISIKLFFELFLSILESGISIPVALKSLCKNSRTSYYASNILKEMDNNSSFSKSIIKLSKSLTQYEQMILISEETGDVKPVLRNIILELNEKNEDKKNLFVILIYPSLIILFAFILSCILYKYGIPYISQIAQISKEELNLGIIKAGFWLLVSSIALVCFIIYKLTRNSFQYKFFRNMYFLLINSVGLEKSLTLLLHTEQFNQKSRKIIVSILDDIRDGDYLWESCQKHKCFDVFTNSWLMIAQDNGQIKESFEKIYNHYFSLRKNDKQILMRIIEPLILLIAGGYIITLIINCVIPIFLSLGNNILL